MKTADFKLIENYFPSVRRTPDISHKKAIEAILFVLSSGCSWRQLPKSYGNWHTVYTRFKRWSEAGLLGKILYELHKNKILNFKVVMIGEAPSKAQPSKKSQIKGQLKGKVDMIEVKKKEKVLV